MKRRDFILGFGSGLGLASAWSIPTGAQSSKKVFRIGYLAPGTTPKGLLDGLITGLRDLGYVEGQNITIEWRMAAGQQQLLPAMASELVQLNVDVIIAVTVLAAVPARKATKSIPIVVLASHDGVGAGIYASLSHPGSNATGIDSLSEVLDAKRIEILKEVLPRLSRLVVLYNPGYPSADKHFSSIDLAARKFDISVRPIEVRAPQDLDKALAAILSDRPDAVLSIADPIETLLREQITAFGTANHLPMINEEKLATRMGQLFSYGASSAAIWQRGAYYIDKVLKGAKPEDLPVEQPTVLELVINRKTAKELGLAIPDALLATADEVID